MNRDGFLVGVDVGGTFTDVIAFSPRESAFQIAKVPTSADDPSIGVMRGLDALDISLERIETLIHGTTVGTNAVLQRRGARCGLITTRGFRDTLELGRRTRPQLYGLTGSFEPLVTRQMRHEVSERIDADGNVVIPLQEKEVQTAVEALLRDGAEAVVVHFLHSYRNPIHEQRCAEIVRRGWPNSHVIVGSDVLPEFREFERASTAAVNAYLQPIIGRYIGRLQRELKRRQFGPDLLIMQGNGGMMTADIAVEHAVQTVLSGPAAGAICAAKIGLQAGFPNIISCDMGGTSFDVTTITAGEPAITSEKDICYSVPVRVPMIDIHTIGAGGGSIARVNRAGILQVGPDSAGSWPGPICYGRGGGEPTVSDAQLVLGRLDAQSIAGIDQTAPVGEVRRQIEVKIARPLGITVEAAAAAIVDVANNQMASAIRLVSIERGHDPRDFVLLAFGGAGPMHAVALARELSVPKVLIPYYPGLVSALGCVVADVRHDFVQNVNQPLDQFATEDADRVYSEHERRGRELLAHEHVTLAQVDVIREADMQFSGQTHRFTIPIPDGSFDRAVVLREFRSRYLARFNIDLPEMRAVVGNLRSTIIGRRSDMDMRIVQSHRAEPGVRVEMKRRPIMFGTTWIDTPVFRREALAEADTIAGPAIIEQFDSTTLVEPGSSAVVDRLGNLLITFG